MADETLSKVMPLVYDELRRVADRYMRRERGAQTLQATALVHEAFLRLFKEGERGWVNRAHFVGIAARSMREILIERARARRAAKRGGGGLRLTLDEGMLAGTDRTVDLLALDEALTRLANVDPQGAKLVELRFFGGLTIEEAAEALGTSPATVKRTWTFAKAWLKRELEVKP